LETAKLFCDGVQNLFWKPPNYSVMESKIYFGNRQTKVWTPIITGLFTATKFSTDFEIGLFRSVFQKRALQRLNNFIL
jgi:hypothetical protein